MAGFDKLKLNKQLIRSATELGYTTPKEIQQKTLTRIIGGQDIIAIAPEGAGKTTTYVLGTLNRFNYAPEGVPKVLILVPSISVSAFSSDTLAKSSSSVTSLS